MLEPIQSRDDLEDAAATNGLGAATLESFNSKDDSGLDFGYPEHLTDSATALLWKLGECLQSQGEVEAIPEQDERQTSPGPLNYGEVASEARAQALRALRKRRGRDDGHGGEKEKRNPSVSPAGSSVSQTDEMTLMAESLITFGKQLKTLQEHQVQQDEIHQDYMRKIISKLDALQNLCNDTATMGMQHAQAVLGIGLRIEVLENQVGHVMDEKASPDSPSPASSSTVALSEFSKINSNGNSAPVEPSAGSTTPGASACSNSTTKAQTDFQQQYAETALKVFGQVSSIETRVSKLEESIAAEVKLALSDLGFSRAGKDAVRKSPVALNDVIRAGKITNQALTRLTQISQSSGQGSATRIGSVTLPLKHPGQTNSSSNGISYANNLLNGSPDRQAALHTSGNTLPVGGSMLLKRPQVELVCLEDGIPEHALLDQGLSRSLHSLQHAVQSLKPSNHNDLQQQAPPTSTQTLGPKQSPQVSSQVKRVQLTPQLSSRGLLAPDRSCVVREQSAPTSRVQRLLSQPVLPSDLDRSRRTLDGSRRTLDHQTPRKISGMGSAGSAGSPPLSSRQTLQPSTPQTSSRQLLSPQLTSRQLASPQVTSRHVETDRGVALISGGKSPVPLALSGGKWPMPPALSGGKSPVRASVTAGSSTGTTPLKSPPSTPVTGWRNVATAIMPTRMSPGTVNQIESI